jgi:hypothetical protein
VACILRIVQLSILVVKFLPTLFLRATLLPLLLLGLLSGCTVYDSIFHPHRLPTPKMDAVTKAKIKAAEKARHKGLSLKAADESGTNATNTEAGGGEPAAPGGADEKKKTMSYSELPEGTRIKYDKQGLVRKSLLERKANNGRKLHHYDTRPLTPREASLENRKIRKKGHTDHSSGGAPARDNTPAERAPATSPGEAPLAPAESVPAPKAKVAAPQPDPTQPAPEPAPKLEKGKKKASKTLVPKPDPTQPAPGQ